MAFFNDSKFNMWRASFSIVWIDGVFTQEEKIWVDKKISTLKFTDEQKKIISLDLEQQTPLSDIVGLITDKTDKAFLAHQIRIISHLDGMDEAEEETLRTWRKCILENIDLQALSKLVELDEIQSYHEDEIYKVHNKYSLIEKTYKMMRKSINFKSYIFPDND